MRQLGGGAPMRPAVGVNAVEKVIAVGLKQGTNGNVHDFELLVFRKFEVAFAQFLHAYDKENGLQIEIAAKLGFEGGEHLLPLLFEFFVVKHGAKVSGCAVHRALVKTLIMPGPVQGGGGLFSGMNFLDLLILIPAIWGFWRGFTKGVIMEVATLAAFFIGVWGGIHLSDALASMIRGWMGSQSEYIPLVAFALVFVGILMTVYGVAKLVDRVAEKAALSIVNKIAGGAFGGFKFVLILSVLFFVLDAVQKSVPLLPPQIKEGSLLYGPVAKVAPAVIPGLTESNLGEMIPKKEDVEVDVDVNLKLKDSTKKEDK